MVDEAWRQIRVFLLLLSLPSRSVELLRSGLRLLAHERHCREQFGRRQGAEPLGD